MTIVANVRLKNGTEAPNVLVRATMLTLEKLLASEPIAFYELYMACTDPGHVIFGNCAGKLTGFGLLDSVDGSGHGKVSSAVRDIVLSALVGEDFNLELRSPLADEADQ